MNRRLIRALLAVIVGAIVLVAVGAVAYHFGATNGGHGFGPMMRGRGGFGGFGGSGGWDLLSMVAALLFAIVVIWLVAALLGFGRTPSAAMPPAGATSATPEGLERLKELSDLHDRGALSDEEFTAAKRRLLGL
jgi:uncharacterized membrane protein